MTFIQGAGLVSHCKSLNYLMIVVMMLHLGVAVAHGQDSKGAAVESSSLSRPSTGLPAADLPDAPSPADPQAQTSQSQNPATGALGPIPPVYTGTPLTFRDRWIFYTHTTFGPPSVLNAAFGGGIRMVHPKDTYPREWRDGAGAFGRWYGDAYATQASKHTAEFLSEALLHEDPRYRFAPQGTGFLGRVTHALAFTIVDRTDSERPTLAFGNFASAAAGGFVGMAYLPDGYNDLTHAGQRATFQFGLIGVSNIAREFSPQWYPVVKKLHVPKILPAWWVPGHDTKP